MDSSEMFCYKYMYQVFILECIWWVEAKVINKNVNNNVESIEHVMFKLMNSCVKKKY